MSRRAVALAVAVTVRRPVVVAYGGGPGRLVVAACRGGPGRLVLAACRGGPGRLVLAALAAAGAALLALATPAPAAAASFRPCATASGGCTRVTVPLDRSGALPGRLSLFVARDRARRPVRRALFVLAGGPGQASSSLVGMLPGALAAAVRNRYDVIGVDDRGTGRSGLLRCPEVERLRRFRSPRAAAACAERLGLARARYTTQETVADLEDVRAALGYERIALYGTSYGTKLAIAYARAIRS